MKRIAVLVGLLLLGVAAADPQPEPDVVVVVDSSYTMRNPGMDAQRVSLLLTKLLVDLVPGRLAVVRLLDLKNDAALLPSKATGQVEPCDEDPGRPCAIIAPDGDWGEKARAERLGVAERPRRADPDFKRMLESHLAQDSFNSQFFLSFRAAQGVFEQHAGAGGPAAQRTLIWLSDGKDESKDALPPSIAALRALGVEFVTVVFGRGDPSIAQKNGLTVDRASTPAELMRTFAQAFRLIVGAPYRIDHLLSAAPEFRMRERVEEAWVVVYGDRTLGEVSVSGPGGTVAADYAAEVWPTAGAYRVAHLTDPQAGTWRVRAQGGGPGTAYAVVQRSALAPVLLAPTQAAAGTRVRLVAGLRAKGASEVVADREVLDGARLTVAVAGSEIDLLDDGRDADETAGDGRFSAWYSFPESGRIPVQVSIDSPLVRRATGAEVEVSGTFRYDGGPVAVDFGRLVAPARACRGLRLAAEQRGTLPFVLEPLGPLPDGHTLTLRGAGAALSPNGAAVGIAPGTALEVCLDADRGADSSRMEGRPLLRLRLAGSSAPDQAVDLVLSWDVQGLTWWQRWGWLVLSLLALLAAVFIALGYLLPQRFPRTLCLSFAPELADVEETPPLALYTWRGVGIGFYRDARAYLHGDFRVSGRARGALAALHAERGGARVLPGKGLGLYRQDFGAAWDEVPLNGERARAGEVYRIGEQGPYFRIGLRV